jgi:signal transduction histidine kinase
MESKRRNIAVYGLLAGLWALIVVWQLEEHAKVEESARTDLRRSSKAIKDTLGAYIQGMQVYGAVFRQRLEPVLNEMVGGETNVTVKSRDLLSIELLNGAGDRLASAGQPIDADAADLAQGGERWGPRSVVMVYAVEGADVSPEGRTNSTTIIPNLPPPPTNGPDAFRNRFRRDGRPDPRTGAGSDTNAPPWDRGMPNEGGFRGGQGFSPGPIPEFGPGDTNGPPREMLPSEGMRMRPPFPFWARARGMTAEDYLALIKDHELHGLVLALSTDTLEAASHNDLWMRAIIVFFASVSALGAGLAWRTLNKTSELQIRLVRASELNTHLKEMNLAAAGLAHETRNPLNIIRGLAQMISKQPEAPAEIRGKSREIVEEADKVTAQLNEFINYSRPRELRRVALPLSAAVQEVIRALGYDIEEKRVKIEAKIPALAVEADEQLFRQALFNLVINAIQAVDEGGEIKISAERHNGEAILEIRDNGPGVPPERRQEIFKPYFTTTQKGTGLGLAVVQQIVLAHGWEIQCSGNEPKGAVFRLTHLKIKG